MAFYKKRTSSDPGMSKEDKMNLFMETRKAEIIESLNQLLDDKPIWQSPVFTTKYINPVSGAKYNIENSVLLLGQMRERALKNPDEKEKLPFFMTFNQAKNSGLIVPKGTKSFAILKRFGKKYEVTKLDEATGQEEIEERFRRAASIDFVFNISDLEGELSAKLQRNMSMGFSKATNEEAKVILEALEATSPVKITRVTDFNSSSGSYYVPSAEFINLPPSSLFRNVIEEISTLAHEIAHSWGHSSRLNRETLNTYSQDNKARAEEELVANVASQAVVNHFGLELDDKRQFESYEKNHDTYDFGWAKLLKDNPDSITTAIQNADKTAGKMIAEVELWLSNKLKDNPDLAVSEFIKDRINKKQEKEETPEENPAPEISTSRKPSI